MKLRLKNRFDELSAVALAVALSAGALAMFVLVAAGVW